MKLSRTSRRTVSLLVFCLAVLIGINFSVITTSLTGAPGLLLANNTSTTPSVTNTSTTNTSSSTNGATVVSAKLDNPITYETGADLIGAIVKAFLGVIGALAILVIIYGGVLYITAAGNEENLKKAKAAVTGAAIGLAVALLAYVIVDFVIKVLSGSGS